MFHNGSSYDYHVTVKELAQEFEKQFTCLRENTKKCITFSVPIEKQIIRIDKKEANYKNLTNKKSYRLEFITVQHYSSLSNFVNNLAETNL